MTQKFIVEVNTETQQIVGQPAPYVETKCSNVPWFLSGFSLIVAIAVIVVIFRATKKSKQYE